MQSTFVDASSYLQLCSAELPGHCIVVQADFKLTGGSAVPRPDYQLFFFWWKMANRVLHICFNAYDKDLLLVIYHKTCQYRITTSFVAVRTHQFNAFFRILKQCCNIISVSFP